MKRFFAGLVTASLLVVGLGCEDSDFDDGTGIYEDDAGVYEDDTDTGNSGNDNNSGINDPGSATNGRMNNDMNMSVEDGLDGNRSQSGEGTMAPGQENAGGDLNGSLPTGSRSTAGDRSTAPQPPEPKSFNDTNSTTESSGSEVQKEEAAEGSSSSDEDGSDESKSEGDEDSSAL